MGFLSCFGCGSDKEVKSEEPSQATKPTEASTVTNAANEKARADEQNKNAPGKNQRQGSAGPAEKAAMGDTPNNETDPRPAQPNDPLTSGTTQSPIENFGAQYRIDDEKIRQAMEDNPYPTQPDASDFKEGDSETAKAVDGPDEWHDAAENYASGRHVDVSSNFIDQHPSAVTGSI